MLRCRPLLGWVAMLGACGRIYFDPTTTPGDLTADGRLVGDDGSRSGANLVFATRMLVTGDFGGIAGADQLCTQAARDAGWSGTFVSFMSDSTTDARDRLAGSHGWVRTDGTPVGNTVAEILDQWRMFHPINLDERGAIATDYVWTGSLADGRRATSTCTDWTATTTLQGTIHIISSSLSPGGTLGLWACTSPNHIYCFEVGRNVDVAPDQSPPNARRAFVSSVGRTNGAHTIADMDLACGADATAASLPGTYLAAMATSTATIESRFTLDQRPWIRVDGTQLAANSTEFFSEAFFEAPTLQSFPNQLADGTYVGHLPFFSGASAPDLLGDNTCGDWSAFNGSSWGWTGDPAEVAAMWQSSNAFCNDVAPRVLCLQQ